MSGQRRIGNKSLSHGKPNLMTKLLNKFRKSSAQPSSTTAKTKSDETYRLDKYVEPVDQLVTTVFGVSMALLVVRPTFWQLLLIFAFDSLMFIIFSKLDIFYFKKRVPGSELFNPEPKWRDLGKEELEEKKQILSDAFESYQASRLSFLPVLNAIKVLPSALFALIVINKLTLSNIAFLYLALIPLNLFFTASSYLYVTRIFQRERSLLNQRASVAYRRSRGPARYFFSMNVAIFSIFLSTFGLQIALAYKGMSFLRADESTFWVAIHSGVMCLVLALRLWWHSQNKFQGQLNDMITEIRARGLDSTSIPIETPSIDIIQSLAEEINHLFARITKNETDLTEATVRRADAVKFEALGEITALVAHDLSGPLHAVRFFSDEISERTEEPTIKNLANKVRMNSDRAVELLHALKLRVRDPNVNAGEKSISLLEAHHLVVSLLKTQFRGDALSRISFEYDQSLAQAFSSIATTDLLHIFDNIYRNSVSHFLRDRSGQGTIDIRVQQKNSESIVLTVSDNGAGISPENFEKKNSRQGLGLKLVRKLIEKNNGKISLLTDSAQAGTTFVITLPLATATKGATVPTQTASKEALPLA